MKASLYRYSQTIILVFLLSAGCKSYVDVLPPAKGSVENPVQCDMPAGERRYLRLLRGPDGAPVQYEYLDSVMGPSGHVLDRFRIENPARKTDSRSIFARLWDYALTDPVVPPHFRIYMDLYFPGILDSEPIPGYKVKPD